MRHAVVALVVLHHCSAFQQPQTIRRAATLHSAKPKVVVFDLDGCLWDPEMYMLSWRGGAPFTPEGDAMVAQSGERVVLLGAAREILRELRSDKWSAIKVGISSRTDEPAWAAELLEKFKVDGMSLGSCFDFREITKESKSAHFGRIKEHCSCEYEDMLFFDNEYGNCQEISSLGVTVCFSPDGVTGELWTESLEAFPSNDIMNGRY